MTTKAKGETEEQWATSASLPKRPWKDVVLPVLGKKVRVRYLGAREGATLAYIPELQRFALLMAQRLIGALDDAGTTIEERERRFQELEVERQTYKVVLAHVMVLDSRAASDPEYCEECKIEHPPALWTRAQCDLLDPADLQLIASTAERQEELEALAPFSKDPAPNDSPSSADTGESTLPTNS